MDSKQPQDDGPLNSLQIMRGVAASVVAFYHSYLITAQPEYIGVEVLKPLASRGWLGVNLFFVLSGFIILLAHHRDLGSPRSIGPYALKRFIRIYPVYWIFLLVYLVAAAAGIGHPNFQWDAANIASAFTLVKLSDSLSLPLRVAWTLFYEVAFYAAFASFLIHVRLGLALFVAWSAVVLIAAIGFDYRQLGVLNAWNLYFPAGMLAYLLFRRLPTNAGLYLFTAGCVSFVWAAATALGSRDTFAAKDPLAALAFIIPCALIILGAALLERHHRWTTPKPLLVLGEASYSVYLVHSGVISVLAIVYARLHLTFIPASFFFFFVALASIAAGVAAHFLVERPLLRMLRSALLRSRARSGATRLSGQETV